MSRIAVTYRWRVARLRPVVLRLDTLPRCPTYPPGARVLVDLDDLRAHHVDAAVVQRIASELLGAGHVQLVGIDTDLLDQLVDALAQVRLETPPMLA